MVGLLEVRAKRPSDRLGGMYARSERSDSRTSRQYVQTRQQWQIRRTGKDSGQRAPTLKPLRLGKTRRATEKPGPMPGS